MRVVASAIHTEKLTKRYGSADALVDLDLDVPAGEVFGYLGPNGAGTSTTISLLLGFIRPSAGRAEIFGMDVRRDAEQVHARLAYVPSVPDLWPGLTGAETLRFLANIHGSVDEAYRDQLIERFELEPNKKVRAYSHGNRQKLPLIAAFASRADLLLLDEPTTGLDPLMEQVFQACVREARDRGQTVFLSSHILSEVEAVCERVAMLRRGRIVETGELDVLRGLASLHVEADLVGPVPDLHGIAGIDNIVIDHQTLHCDVSGGVGPLLARLTEVGVERLTTREPSLEELFVAHYGDREPA
jgi:ABC-2 type transport system ATP-binding protein